MLHHLPEKGLFDIIIANINRNILLNDMKQYITCMHPGSELYMSGFYVDDIAVIREEAEKKRTGFCTLQREEPLGRGKVYLSRLILQLIFPKKQYPHVRTSHITKWECRT